VADQIGLFGDPPPKAGVRPAAVSARVAELAAKMPDGILLGGSTWSFPGWRGLVYDDAYAEGRLAREGLAAYAQHPLLGLVGLDRTHYQPPKVADLQALAAQVPAPFRFLVKAHEDVTLARFPDHARYGTRRGQPSARFLDPAYTSEAVVGPWFEGLGAKAGALLFQFAQQRLGSAPAFAERLHRFLEQLPRGPLYAVELRNPELLGPAYAAALHATGACHCLSVYSSMPELAEQVRLTEAGKGPALVVRWIVPPGGNYATAGLRLQPFDRLKEPDERRRRQIATLALKAHARGLPVYLSIHNTAEGSGPLSIVELAAEMVGRVDRRQTYDRL
jgi:uncharacterized protein YecE (DUF72 family)